MSTLSQRIIWTALPRGWYPDGSLHVVAYITPQLSTDDGFITLLADWDDWRTWPATLDKVDWHVLVQFLDANGGPGAIFPSATVEPIFDLPLEQRVDLWSYSLSLDTTVNSFVPAPPWLGDSNIISYPGAQLGGIARNVYRDILTNGDASELPAVQRVQNLLRPFTFGRDLADRAIAQQELDQDYAAQKFVSPKPGDPAAAMLQHEQFLDSFPHNITEPSATATPERDFHEWISHVGHYRELVRHLGFAVDLKVTFDQAGVAGPPIPDGDSPPDPCFVRLVPQWEPLLGDAATVNVRPVTRAQINADFFLAAPREERPLLNAGRLPLADTPRYQAIEVDHDGAAIKLRMLATNVFPTRQQTLQQLGTALPSLRSGGISVAMAGDPNDADKPPLAGEVKLEIERGLRHASFIADAKSLRDGGNEGQGILLSAEDLMRGIRYDVWTDLTSRWQSLHQRTGRFTYKDANGNDQAIPSTDEAVAPIVPTKDANGGQASDLRMQQTLFHWTGWSLGAHRPGTVLPKHYQHDDPTVLPQVVEPPTDFPLGFDPPVGAPELAAGFQAVPGSLPRLRFGAHYRVRGRAADLAGDSVELPNVTNPASPAFVGVNVPTPPLFYGRFEPVAAPPLALQQPNTEGESVERLVIRSNFTFDPQYPDQPAAPNPETVTSARHVLPPKSSVEMVERHGKLDGPGDPPVDVSMYPILLKRDAAALPGETSGINTAGTPEPANQLHCEWLPDPMARGVTFRGLPGAGALPVPVTFLGPGHGWIGDQSHDYAEPIPFRFVLKEPDGGPIIQGFDDANGRRLEVVLGKGDVRTIRMSSHFLQQGLGDIDHPDLSLFGPWVSWLETDDERKALLPMAVQGLVWLFTPWREITLVHAVRQPLLPPVLHLDYERDFGSTHITLGNDIEFSRKSTSRVDLHAAWPDPVDGGPNAPRPTHPGDFASSSNTPVPVKRALVNVDLFESEKSPDLIEVDQRHELHDTKHKEITYNGEATSAFTEYFTKRLPFTVSNDASANVHALSTHPLVEGTLEVRNADHSKVWPNGWTVTSGANPTLTLDKATIPVGTALEIAFLERPISRFSPATQTLHVNASARPAAPKIDRVVPTFLWVDVPQSSLTAPQRKVTSARDGSTFRVYLQRPWWTSGQDEKLGVVLSPGAATASATDIPTVLVPYVTQWGADPAVASSPLPNPLPSFNAFPMAVNRDAGLFLDELPHADGQPDHKVAVAIHAVDYDDDQHLWFSDVQVATGSAYQPFVRLALARYQPFALSDPAGTNDVHLSRVVLADILQTSPGRTAVVSWTPSSRDVTITLSGLAGESAGGRPLAYVTLEQRRGGVPDPDVGWRIVQGPVPMRGGLTQPTAIATWQQALQLPTNASAAQYRIIIRQTDQYQQGNGLGERPVYLNVINLF